VFACNISSKSVLDFGTGIGYYDIGERDKKKLHNSNHICALPRTLCLCGQTNIMCRTDSVFKNEKEENP
jgi:hypothetical protein